VFLSSQEGKLDQLDDDKQIEQES